MSKFEEKIKLDNFTSQLQSIKGNIRLANEELEAVLVRRKEALADIDERERAFRESTMLLISEKEKVIEDADAKLALLDIREKAIDSRESESLNLIATKGAEVEAHELRLSQLLSDSQDEVRELFERSEQLKASIHSMEGQMVMLSARIAILTTEAEDANQEHSLITAALKQLRDTYKTDSAKIEGEIATLTARREEEEKKIAEASVYIRQKETDIAIMTARLHSLFNEVRPGVALKI